MALLRGARVGRLLDVRLRPDGHLSAYARQRDLRYVLERYEGIAYEHRPELAPTGELLDGYRADGNWDRYRRRFQAPGAADFDPGDAAGLIGVHPRDVGDDDAHAPCPPSPPRTRGCRCSCPDRAQPSPGTRYE